MLKKSRLEGCKVSSLMGQRLGSYEYERVQKLPTPSRSTARRGMLTTKGGLSVSPAAARIHENSSVGVLLSPDEERKQYMNRPVREGPMNSKLQKPKTKKKNHPQTTKRTTKKTPNQHTPTQNKPKPKPKKNKPQKKSGNQEFELPQHIDTRAIGKGGPRSDLRDMHVPVNNLLQRRPVQGVGGEPLLYTWALPGKGGYKRSGMTRRRTSSHWSAPRGSPQKRRHSVAGTLTRAM